MDLTDLPEKTSLGLFRLIGRSQLEISAAIEHALDEAGVALNFNQFLALKLVGKYGPITAGKLAYSLNYNPGALTRLLDKLEQRGYLVRTPSKNDRRALQLTLTDNGRAIRKKATQCANTATKRVFANVTQPERQQLHTILNRLLNNLHTRRQQ